MTGPQYQAYSAAARWVTLPREQWEHTLLAPGEYTDWRVRCPNEADQFISPGDVPTFPWDMADQAAPPSVPVEQLITPPVGALPPIAAQPLEAVPAAPPVHLPQATPGFPDLAQPAVAPGAVAMPPAVAPAPMPATLTRFLTQPFVACMLPAAAAVGAYAYRVGDDPLTRAAIAAGAFFAAHAILGRARNGVWSKPADLLAPAGPCPTPPAIPLATTAAPTDAAPNVTAPPQNYAPPGGDIVA